MARLEVRRRHDMDVPLRSLLAMPDRLGTAFKQVANIVRINLAISQFWYWSSMVAPSFCHVARDRSAVSREVVFKSK